MKKIGAVALLVLAIAGLGACSGSGPDEAANVSTTAEPPADGPAEAPVAYAALTGDPAKGEKLFLQCRICHSVEPGQNRIGPSLHAVIGRPAGQLPDFSYSPANRASGIVWSEAELFKFLEAPQKTLPGTRMAYAGMKPPQDRADVIAYLKAAAR